MAITVTLTDQKLRDGTRELKLDSPYSPTFPAKAKAIGGRWSATTKTWRFDTRDVERVRALCLEAFGVDPLATAPAQLVTVRVDVDALGYQVANQAEIWMFGREIVRRPARDWSVKLGANVILIAGGFPSSGGSAKHPAIQPKAGTVLEVRDVPATLVEQVPSGAVTIVGDAPAPSLPTQAEQVVTLAAALSADDRQCAILAILAQMSADERAAVLAPMRPSPLPTTPHHEDREAPLCATI